MKSPLINDRRYVSDSTRVRSGNATLLQHLLADGLKINRPHQSDSVTLRATAPRIAEAWRLSLTFFMRGATHGQSDDGASCGAGAPMVRLRFQT